MKKTVDRTPKRILLIAQKPDISGPVSGFLKEMGYQVAVCDSAKAALNVTSIETPELIICHDALQGVTGSDLGRLLKANTRLAAIPFLLMTNRIPASVDLDRADLNINADELIRLPISQSELYGVVTKWLESSHKPESIQQKAAGPFREEEKSKEQPSWKKGHLSCASLGRLLYRLASQDHTGILLVAGGRKRMEVKVRNGSVIDVNSNYIRDDTLGRFLIRHGKISAKENDATLARAQKAGVPQGRVLVSLGILSEKELSVHLAQQKVEKFLRLFEDSWEGASFEFTRQIIEPDEMSIEPAPLSKLIQKGVLEVAKPDQLYDTFLRSNKTNNPILLHQNVVERLKSMGVSMEAVKTAEWIHGKSIEEIKKVTPNRFEPFLRTAFYLIVSNVAAFGSADKKEGAPKPAEREVLGRSFERIAEKQIDQAPDRPSGTWNIREYEDSLADGRSLLNAKHYTYAVAVLRKAVQANPDSSEALSLLAWARFQQNGKSSIPVSQEAKDLLKKALSLEPSNDQAHYFLGSIFKHEGKESLAASHFQKATAFNPANEDAAREIRLLRIKQRKDRDY